MSIKLLKRNYLHFLVCFLFWFYFKIYNYGKLGDTTASVFISKPELLEFPLIICECTFIDDDDLEQAKKTKFDPLFIYIILVQ